MSSHATDLGLCEDLLLRIEQGFSTGLTVTAVRFRRQSGSHCRLLCSASLRPSQVSCTSVCRRHMVTCCRTPLNRPSSLDDVATRSSGKWTSTAAFSRICFIALHQPCTFWASETGHFLTLGVLEHSSSCCYSNANEGTLLLRISVYAVSVDILTNAILHKTASR